MNRLCIVFIFSSFWFLGAIPAFSTIPGTAASVKQATGINKGLCLLIGIEDASFASEMAGETFLIHGLIQNDEKLASIRNEIRNKNQYGQVSFEALKDLTRLPYPSHFANLILADLENLGEKAPSETELKRILAPLGQLYVHQNGNWKTIDKPWPETMDDWSHYDYNAERQGISRDQLAGPRTSLKWIDWYERLNHVRAQSSEFVSEKGVVFHEALVSADADSWGKSQNWVVARDGFNGLVFWKKSRNRGRGYPFIAHEGKLITPFPDPDGNHFLSVFDGKTGDLQRHLTSGFRMEELSGKGAEKRMRIAAVNGVLVQTGHTEIYGIDVNTGTRKWSYKDETGNVSRFFCISREKGMVFVIVQSQETDKQGWSRWLGQPVEAVVALDLQNGTKKWRNTDIKGNVAGQIIYSKGYLSMFSGNGIATWSHNEDEEEGADIAVLKADNGELLWNKNFTKDPDFDGYAFQVYSRNDKLQIAGNSTFSEFNWENGNVNDFWRVSPMVVNQTCVRPRGTNNYMFIGHGVVVDNQGNWKLENITRGDCATGLIPANGMVYNSPNGCECFSMIRGYMGLSPEPLWEPVADESRLESPEGDIIHTDLSEVFAPQVVLWDPAPLGGGCGGRCRDKEAKKQSDPWGWKIDNSSPYYVEDDSLGPLKNTSNHIKDSWTNNDAFPQSYVTAPLHEGGRTYVGVIHQHQLEAREGGNVVWTFTAGGRISSPPTVFGNLLLFGSHDGYVYALNKADGSLQYRFLAAPNQKRISAYGQLESPWPVYHVLSYKGTAVFSAGRHPELDGGIFMYAIEPQTGKIIWRTRTLRVPEWHQNPDSDKTRYYSQWRNVLVNDFMEDYDDHIRMSGLKIFPGEKGTLPSKISHTFSQVSSPEFELKSGILLISGLNGAKMPVDIRISDPQGRIAAKGTKKPGQLLSVPVKDLARGNYYVTVLVGNRHLLHNFTIR